jgi:hypothetical protein
MSAPPLRPAAPTACVFCGGTPVTEEDVWALWIGKYLGREPGRESTWSIGYEAQALRNEKSVSYKGKATCVCEPCNTRWMSTIENSASRILKKMFDEASELELGRSEQRTLAAWAMKQALMVQYLGPNRLLIPDPVYHDFHTQKVPPLFTTVSIARHPATGPTTNAHTIGALMGSLVPGTPPSFDVQGGMYGVTFNVYNVVMQVLGCWRRDDEAIGLGPPDDFLSSLQYIWPAAVSVTEPPPVFWPPRGPSLEDQDVVDLGFTLRRVIPIPMGRASDYRGRPISFF